MITPFIHFDYQQFAYDWSELTASKIIEESERLRIAVKQATDYVWDNTHFILETSSGQAGLIIQFASDDEGGIIECWSARTRCSIDCLRIGEPGTETRKKLVESLEEWADQAAKGKAYCCECHKWVDAFKTFGFAGSACVTCYNPKKHLPPDTSGS
jgi:hypothetical protein